MGRNAKIFKSKMIMNIEKMGQMNLVLLAVLLSIAFISLVSATELNYKQGDLIDLKVPCYINGTYCSASATCEITINYPNGTNFVNNQPMIYNPSFFDYTLIDTQVLGEYPSSMVCNDGGTYGHSTFSFTIKPTAGLENNTTMFIIMAVVSFVLLLLAFIFKNNFFAFFSGMMFTSTGVYTMIYGFGDVATSFTQIMSYVLIGFGALLIVVSFLDIIKESSSGGESQEDED